MLSCQLLPFEGSSLTFLKRNDCSANYIVGLVSDDFGKRRRGRLKLRDGGLGLELADYIYFIVGNIVEMFQKTGKRESSAHKQ